MQHTLANAFVLLPPQSHHFLPSCICVDEPGHTCFIMRPIMFLLSSIRHTQTQNAREWPAPGAFLILACFEPAWHRKRKDQTQNGAPRHLHRVSCSIMILYRKWCNAAQLLYMAPTVVAYILPIAYSWLLKYPVMIARECVPIFMLHRLRTISLLELCFQRSTCLVSSP